MNCYRFIATLTRSQQQGQPDRRSGPLRLRFTT